MKHFADTLEDDEEDLAELYHQSGNVRDQEEGPTIGHNHDADLEQALRDLEFHDLGTRAKKVLMVKLLMAVEGGYATPAQENTLRQLLKDNGFVMNGDPFDANPEEGRKARPKAPLPEFSQPDYLAR
jgi:hypothetical protein